MIIAVGAVAPKGGGTCATADDPTAPKYGQGAREFPAWNLASTALDGFNLQAGALPTELPPQVKSDPTCGNVRMPPLLLKHSAARAPN